MLSRWKESPGVPTLGFFGGPNGTSERGRKKEEASSHIQRKKTWEVQKLKRARTSIFL
jgi:hypothetical protein